MYTILPPPSDCQGFEEKGDSKGEIPFGREKYNFLLWYSKNSFMKKNSKFYILALLEKLNGEISL